MPDTPHSHDIERRVFVILECIFKPVSLLTVFVLLPVQIIGPRYGMAMPPWFIMTGQVLLAAAVGYLTNFIALEMLFKPFERTWKHWISICTFGYWRQGLIPKNKPQIGAKIGVQIEKRLLQPEALSAELTTMLLGSLDQPELLTNLRSSVQKLIADNHEQLRGILAKLLDTAIHGILDSVVTPVRLRDFLCNVILPAAHSPQLKQLAAKKILTALDDHAPEIAVMLRTEIAKAALAYMEKNPLFAMFNPPKLVESILGQVDWNDVQQRIRAKINAPETHTLLADKLEGCLDDISTWLDSPESQSHLDQLVFDIKIKLPEHLQASLPAAADWIIEQLTDSNDIWNYLQSTLLPAAKPALESLLRTHGQSFIANHLKLGERATQAIERQDVREFYDMINDLAAQHLGAIQVLGYILGAIVGALQLLI